MVRVELEQFCNKQTGREFNSLPDGAIYKIILLIQPVGCYMLIKNIIINM